MHFTMPQFLRRFLPDPEAPNARQRTPTVLQMEAVECGAACLCMILGYHGCFIPLEEARIACGVSRDGSKASNLVRAGRRYGLDARGLRAEPSDLSKIRLPAILHWNMNHFVVLEGLRGDRVFLNDPGHGPRTVDRDELHAAFSGIVLTFEAGESFVRAGTPPGMIGPLFRRLKNSAGHFALVVGTALLLVIPGLAAPAFSKVFVDEILVSGSTDWLRPLLIAMILTALTIGLLTLLQREVLVRLEIRLAAVGAAQFFWHVLRLPVAFFSQRYGGEVGARVGMNDRIAAVLSGEVAVSFVGALTVALYAAAMFQFDVLLAMIGVVAAGSNVAFLWWMGRERRDASQRLIQERGKLIGAAMGGLQTIESLKAAGSESDFFGRWAGHHAKALNAQQYLGLRSQLLLIVPGALAALATAVVLGLGANRVIDGMMTVGGLVAFQGLLVGFLNPIGRFVSLGGTIQEMHGDLRRLDDVLLAEQDVGAPVTRMLEPRTRETITVAPRLRGGIEVVDLTFGFSPLDPPLLDGFSLHIDPGECVAIVGGSGSGKSTLARLLCGLYTPWSGKVLFDGTPRVAQDPRVIATSIGYVDQEIFLFEGSVRENLTLWDDSIPEPAVIRAAQDAYVHDVIVVRPGGYRTNVSEGGRNFSGGQRQRLEIARALAVRPSILVLDEATSALDAETEQCVNENIRRRGCTCVIVAHRLSAVRDADRILVMMKGSVVEAGSHEELMNAGGLYRELMERE